MLSWQRRERERAHGGSVRMGGALVMAGLSWLSESGPRVVAGASGMKRVARRGACAGVGRTRRALQPLQAVTGANQFRGAVRLVTLSVP